MVEEVVPVLKHRTSKPKTAGGFLKKYSVEELVIRPDFEIYFA